jgi:uncharacterized protein
MIEYFSPDDVRANFAPLSWQRMLFAEFESTMLSATRPFPCVFGVAGLKSQQIRFAFCDPLSSSNLEPIVGDYLTHARSFGRMTSLVAFDRPGPVEAMESYRKRFWLLLDELERLDPQIRPAFISEDLDTPAWEFCFAGEPVFVVCSSPAHVLRQSRRSTSFMVTFQPRWVFENIIGSDNPAVKRSLRTIRNRLSKYDAVEPYPFLGQYGAPDNREYQQYFIDDTNTAPACPFKALGRTRSQQKGEAA